MVGKVVHCARTGIEGSIIPLDLKDLYTYYKHCQQMAVKSVVLTKSGK